MFYLIFPCFISGLFIFILWRTDWDKQAKLVSDAFLHGIIEKF